MAKKAWAAFPYPDKAFDYDGRQARQGLGRVACG